MISFINWEAPTTTTDKIRIYSTVPWASSARMSLRKEGLNLNGKEEKSCFLKEGLIGLMDLLELRPQTLKSKKEIERRVSPLLRKNRKAEDPESNRSQIFKTLSSRGPTISSGRTSVIRHTSHAY